MFGRKTVLVRLDAEWVDRIDIVAAQQGTTRNAVIRHTIRTRFAPKTAGV